MKAFLAPCVSAAVLVGILLTAPVAQAYRTGSDLPELPNDQAISWESTPEMSLFWGDVPGLSIADAGRAIEGAARAWEAVSCSDFSIN